MSIFRRVFASKEVKAALGVVDECEFMFSPAGLHGDSFNIIKAELVPYLYKTSANLKEQVQNGRTVRACVYTSIAVMAQSHISSGQYHMYRGVLRPMGPGPALHEICRKAIDLLIKEGDVTEEDAQRWKNDIVKQISEVG
jgi:hypothetical protein